VRCEQTLHAFFGTTLPAHGAELDRGALDSNRVLADIARGR
jgi:hypothetical protein